MEPFTTLIAGGLAWIATQAAAGVVGNSADRMFASAVRGIRERLSALAGKPEGDDLARGLRRAQLRALERLLADYRESGLLAQLAPGSDPFFVKTFAFCRSSTAIAVQWDQLQSADGGLLALSPAADDAHSAITGAALVEDATLAELTAALDGARIPSGFVEHFRGGSRGKPRFIDLFEVYFNEEVKENDSFRNVLHTHLLLRFGGALSRLESGVADLAVEQRAGFTDLADEQRAGFAHLQARLAALSEAVSTQKGVPPAPLRSILERLGESGVPDEELPSRLAAKADEYLALRERWLKVGKDTPDVDVVRREALALIDGGDLGGARRLFVDARSVIRAVRERRAREEAALLAGEAEVDRLQLRYLAAADRYAEAEALVVAFDARARFNYLYERANAMQQHGREFGENTALTEAAELWRTAAHLCPRVKSPLDWAMTQYNLGKTLTILGHREGGAERLEAAVEAYRGVLEVFTRERAPLAWAVIQNDLGNTLQILGELESGTDRLEAAVEAYRAALEENTRERVPLDWAKTQNHLGGALRSLGEREHGVARLGEAVEAYGAALQEYTRERLPLDWAMTQNNLGNALSKLGERERSTERLEKAVEAYREALEECTRGRMPVKWATIQNNMGNALKALGKREGGTKRLEEAIEAYRAALQEYTRERLPLDWAMTQNNLGTALSTLGNRERGTERLGKAVEAYGVALEVFEAAGAEYYIAVTRTNLGRAQALLGQRLRGQS